MTNVAADETVGDDAGRERCEDDARRDQEEVDKVAEVECMREYGQERLLSKIGSMRFGGKKFLMCCHEVHPPDGTCDAA